MRQAKLKAVMVDTGVNIGTNAGSVNAPDASEKNGHHLYSHLEQTLKKIKVVEPR